MLKLAAKFVPAADEVYRMQNQDGTDPECRLFQKFAELGHYGGRPGTTRQGTYATTPSGVLLGSINSNDPVRIADMLQRALAKWQTLSREDRMSSTDPQKQLADIKRPERFYPKDGLVLYVTSRDMPRKKPRYSHGQGLPEDWRPGRCSRASLESGLRLVHQRRSTAVLAPASAGGPEAGPTSRCHQHASPVPIWWTTSAAKRRRLRKAR